MIRYARRLALGLGPPWPPGFGRAEVCAAVVERDSVERPPFRKVAGARAALVGGVLDAASRAHNVPLAYLLAVVRQESRFDPDVVNPNAAKRTEEGIRAAFAFAQRVRPRELARIRALPEEPKRQALERLVDLLFSDWGLAQASGRNLFALDVPPSRALDPRWAAEHAAGGYRGLLDWAKGAAFERGGRRIPVDPLQAAAMAYNRGRKGAELVLEQRTDPQVEGYRTPAELAAQTAAGWRHVRAVMGHYRRYLADLEGIA